MMGFSATLLSAMLWPSLPPLVSLPFLCLGAIVLTRRAPIVSGSLLAMLWLTGFCLLLSRQGVPISQGPISQEPIQVRGEIISLVSQNRDWLSLDIEVDEKKLIFEPKRKLRLSWQAYEKVEIGQIWSFKIIPKTISSVLNQGGYNGQKQLLSQHIVGKGRIIEAKLIESRYSLRSHLIERLTPEVRHLSQGDILLALLLGDKSLITQEKWQELRQTGTGHLVAISGLHLSVVCAWFYTISFLSLCYFAPNFGRRNWIISVVVSGLAALLYAYLAGFGIATQRAIIMILLIIVLSLFNRFSTAWDRLLFALFVVLLIDPLSCLSMGFWLSFCALCIILFTLDTTLMTEVKNLDVTEGNTLWGRLKPKLWQFWAIQWRLTLFLGVLQAILFGGVSINSLWINLLVVPWFSFIVIPLAIFSFVIWCLGLLISQSWLGLLQMSDWTLKPYAYLLEHSADLPAYWQVTPDRLLGLTFLAILAGIFWRYLPRERQYWQWHMLMTLLILPMGLYAGQLIKSKSSLWDVHLLDVGQGLAVVVEKDGRALIYDTGASYGDDFSYSERVIVPFLHYRGLTEIDYIFVSHSDNDHAGGASSLIERFPTATRISDVSGINANPCHIQQKEWQSLKLHWVAQQHFSGNNSSCVLRIDDGRHSVLLTGDIEAQAEQALMALNESSVLKLESQLLIAPHHGSRTSSTQAFIQAVNPQIALFPAGLENRYGFPKADVLTRYQALGIDTFTTGTTGQISVTIDENGLMVKTYRQDLAPFWYNRLFRFGDLINPE